MVFPVAVGAFRRVGLFRYEEAGFDVSANQDLDRPCIHASGYVYPMPPGDTVDSEVCRGELGANGAAIRANHGL